MSLYDQACLLPQGYLAEAGRELERRWLRDDIRDALAELEQLAASFQGFTPLATKCRPPGSESGAPEGRQIVARGVSPWARDREVHLLSARPRGPPPESSPEEGLRVGQVPQRRRAAASITKRGARRR